MFSRLRCANVLILKRVRSTGNPHGQGVLWVWDRFHDSLKEKEIGYFTTVNNRDVKCDKGSGISRMWMKSIRSENRILMDGDEDYETRLDLLPETLKEAYKYGNLVVQDRNLQLVRTEWWKKAINGRNEYKAKWYAMGADYSEGATDKCVAVYGHGNRPSAVKEWDYMHVKEYAQIIATYIQNHGFQCRAGVDSIGPGFGVYDMLVTNHYDIIGRVDPCKYKDKSFVSQNSQDYGYKFDNWRSQAYWKLRQDFENGAIDLSAFQTEEGFYDNLHMLQEEILAHTYEEINGLIKIIPKKELRRVQMSNGEPGLGRSPDRADALVIWNWVRDFEYKFTPDSRDTSIDYGITSMLNKEIEDSPWII